MRYFFRRERLENVSNRTDIQGGPNENRGNLG